ncbi:gamma-glutamyl-gamma-aminobutyrate hydrolase family protein [Rhizobium sp. SG2393]|uniref:gamma-glutamyl-gamma-aminobutyrate hydrolase family protein n=1 Tax=Rhizobium sp. SG2393 TaxID=3276279 RepID=UPI00366AB18C
MIRIAVSQRVDDIAGRDERRDGLDQQLVAFLARIDVLPLPMPNGLHACGTLRAWLDDLRPDGLVLSGGNDIGSQSDRDDSEKAALAWAIEGRRPVLGLCRGMQFLGLQADAQLVGVEGHVRTRHALRGEIAREVNSFHAFALSGVPAAYRALARADDGHIEAIRHHDLPIEGWMWHPEREPTFNAQDLERARTLLHTVQGTSRSRRASA